MKPYYIHAFLDISSLVPKTPKTKFKLFLIFNKDNNLDYLKLADINTYTKFHKVAPTTILSNVAVYTNPPINQLNSLENVSIDHLSIWLSNVSSQYPILDTLTIYESFLFSSAIAYDDTYAYFGTYTSPGQVVKINLNTFIKDSTFILNTAESYPRTILTIPLSDHLYIGTGSTPAQIIQLTTDPFIRNNTLSLMFAENYITAIVVVGSYAYLGTATTPGQILKVNLTTFEIEGKIILDEQYSYITCGTSVASGLVTYVCFAVNPGFIIRIDVVSTFDKENLSILDVRPYPPLPINITCCVTTYDYFNNYSPVIFGGSGTNGIVPFGTVLKVKVWTIFNQPMTLDWTAFSNTNEVDLKSAFYDGSSNSVYFVTNASPSIVVRFSIYPFTRTGALTLSVNNVTASTISSSVAYLATSTSPVKVSKVNYSGMSEVGTLTLNTGENLASSIITSGSYVYVGLNSNKVVKVNLTTFTRDSALTLNTDENMLVCGAVYASKAYFGTYTTPGRLVKIDLASFTEENPSLRFRNGENDVRTSVVSTDGRYGYFGTYDSVGIVVKVYLPTLKRVGALELAPTTEYQLTCSVIESSGLYAYFGTYTNLARIVKINLTTFTRQDSIALNSGETNLLCAVIDHMDQYAYFGTGASPSQIVKVGLQPFERKSAIVLNYGETISTMIIDRMGTYLYVGVNVTNSAKVIKINLLTFTREGELTLPTSAIFTGVITSNDMLYFGSNTDPDQFGQFFSDVKGQIIQVSPDYFSSSLVSGSGNQPQQLTNTTTNVQIDFKSQALYRSLNSQHPYNNVIRLAVEGETNELIKDDQPLVIHTQLKLFP